MLNLGYDQHEDRHHFDVNPDLDQDRHQQGNWDLDRNQNDADRQH